ncbi:ATPase component of various ABC-type transport systems with duplicated ATPase domain [Mycolicibacterium chitae]|uniref:ATPase component of various ABC-type transport systems with duplicated ATPase domain n=2 Tax=Mycolicibacterium chitae TaxID=1792 RepID=A0A3S5EIA5_MYCCI|nr:ATPase component of various ABC-type transport systems with duplicated ATPase domain [Mycolicibacterium chitae]
MAQAAVMAALCAACAVIAVVVPFAQGISLLGMVPMGLLAYRYRLRALISAAFAGGAIAFLVAGLGGFMTVMICAYIGGLTGIVKRKGRGAFTVLGASIVAGVAFGLFVTTALLGLSRLRLLIFDTITANATGLARFNEAAARFLDWIGVAPFTWLADGLAATADPIRDIVAWGLRYWPLLVIGYAVFSIMVVSMIGWWVLSRVLEQLRGIPDVHKLETPEPGTPGPLPVQLRDVRFRYPGAEHDALAPIDLDINVGEHIAVTGANGSGKTTLMLLLAGREPTSGTVARPGAVALGEADGTSVVLQHPESQVLGTRVADDVVWGLPPGRDVDVDALLDEVGLAGMGERDTGGLSGGELQRLAVAGALARNPSLLIADEVTSMVDQAGRDALLEVLSGLTRRHSMSVLQITHYAGEAESADRIVSLSESRDNTEMVGTAVVPSATGAVDHNGAAPVIEFDRVSHEYGAGTPWAKSALRDISFTVHEGDGVLIHGGNGSGKSTLAWIMAGLITPTAGTAMVDGKPAGDQSGAVAVAFQAARLQLLRPRVDLEVASAAGFSPGDHDRVVAALARVGLDASLARRRIDQLSGGQMRRVVLAGLLARSPRVLILDEPLAGVDAANQRNLLVLLEELRRETGLTVVVISHDFVGLEGLCPRTLHLRAGVLESASESAKELS